MAPGQWDSCQPPNNKKMVKMPIEYKCIKCYVLSKDKGITPQQIVKEIEKIFDENNADLSYKIPEVKKR